MISFVLRSNRTATKAKNFEIQCKGSAEYSCAVHLIQSHKMPPLVYCVRWSGIREQKNKEQVQYFTESISKDVVIQFKLRDMQTIALTKIETETETQREIMKLYLLQELFFLLT